MPNKAPPTAAPDKLPRADSCRALWGLPASASMAAVLEEAPVRHFFQNLVDQMYAAGTGSATRVARALVMAQPPSIDLGEITDKGSINQRAVLTHRAALVEALYARSDPAILLPRY